jgi:hypothetical protein
MIQDGSFYAAGFFESVAKDRQAIEAALLINGLGQADHCGCPPCLVK